MTVIVRPTRTYSSIRHARSPALALAPQIGCGTGQLTRCLLACGLRVTAVEPGQQLIARARDRLNGVGDVEFVNARLENASLPHVQYSAVFSASAIHWIDPDVSWRKAADVLVDGGSLALVSYFGLDDPRSADDQQALRAAVTTIAPELVADWPTYRDLAGVAARRANLSGVWAWLGAMTEHAVVIAGGGPAGMMLAAELALAKVDVAVVERRPDHVLVGSRAGGFHSRTIEVLDQRGVADRFLAEGQVAQAAMLATTVLDMSDFPTRHPYSLGIWQNQIERIMAAWIAELSVRIYYGCEVTGFAQDDTGVEVECSDAPSLRARYLVGCDGGRSVIRKAAGIEFPGWDPTRSNLIAEVEMAEEPELGVRRDENGIHGIGRLEYEIRDGEVVYKDGGPVRVVLTERQIGPDSEPTLRDLSEALMTVYGTDFGVHNPTWISRFTDMTRQAAAYRAGRVLLAGDSAHVHYPAGGQGLSLGVQDAVNLGWKLAQVVNGTSPESLLDTYHDERHPVAARALKHTMAQTALQRQDERMQALVDVVSELASMDEPRKRLAGIISGLDIHYDLGEGHPLLGRRMPDLDLMSAEGPLRVFELLHSAKPVLLNLGERDSFDITPWADRVQLIDAEYDGLWKLPVLGAVTAPTAVLIRPDGYVAWVGEPADPGLPDALITWFGSPTAA
jgi:2-polyprenyl-6-methoxyphenol hydroxylase-like FAD-dependent oxidoreductase